MIRLFRAEIGKLKGTLAALMVLLGPLAVIAFIWLLAMAKNFTNMESLGWNGLLQFGTVTWAYLVFPLLVALQAAALCNIEHRTDGWKRLFALPVRVPEVFLVKLAILFALMAAATLVLAAGFLGSSWLISMLVPGLPPLEASLVGWMFGKAFACLAGGALMIVLHFALSWTLDSFVFPIAVGVIAVMSVVQVGSSEYWVWHPWTWGMMATASSEPGRAVHAMLLAAGLAVLAIALLAPAARRLRGQS
ncbi:MAG: ABC transporter permease [Gammaproteobacteria bacterium]|nr:ABC transporter permease [Gammaproteobacteria bacterium]